MPHGSIANGAGRCTRVFERRPNRHNLTLSFRGCDYSATEQSLSRLPRVLYSLAMLILSDTIANSVAAAHIGYFFFVVGGVVAIAVGALHGWKWIRNPWFRVSHLAAVYLVIIEEVLNIQCPLNTI